MWGVIDTATHVAVRLDKKSAPISPLYLLYISPVSPYISLGLIGAEDGALHTLDMHPRPHLHPDH